MKYLIILAISIISFSANGQETRSKHNNLEDDLAIKGYDPVAYFTQKKAVKGKKDFEYVYDGIPYRFSSAENRNLFRSDPGKYEPAYGGWCAYAMGAEGEKVKIDPETFKISNGRLYLFYNFFFTNTLPGWNKDEENLRKKADVNWTEITNQ